MSQLILTPLHQPNLIAFALKQIPLESVLQQTEEGYVYLKINDQFIDSLFPLLEIKQKTLPSYSSKPDNIGAHISVIYKDELTKQLKIQELGTLIDFTLKELYEANINNKTFIVLTVSSKKLKNIRKKHGFHENPVYHRISVDFHITIAISIK